MPLNRLEQAKIQHKTNHSATNGTYNSTGCNLPDGIGPGRAHTICEEDNFRALASSIAESDLGAALGARDALPTLRIETEEARVSLHASLASEILAAGLRTLFVAEMRELLSITPRDPPTSPPTPSSESL